MKHVLSKTILISQTIELIAKKYKLTLEEARKRFYNSSVIDMLDDDETGLYGESALYLFSLYEKLTNNQTVYQQKKLPLSGSIFILLFVKFIRFELATDGCMFVSFFTHP